MKTLLVLAQHPELAEAIRALLNPEQYRVIHSLGVDDAEPYLSRGMLDAAIIDVELANVQGLWAIEKFRRRLPRCPLLVFTGGRWEFEEEAYLNGVTNVLSKPPRARLLNALLERLWSAPAAPPAAPAPAQPLAIEAPKEQPTSPGAHRALEVLKDFSAVLTHSLRADALLKQFLLQLREILGVNRAAIFLRQPLGAFGGPPSPEESRRLRSACAIGLSPGLLEHFELSFESGIGGYLFRQGRILRRDSEAARLDVEIQKEFELLGAQVAIPMLDRETLVGVAAFDGRLTGEPLVNGELEIIFHLLEELGLAVKNIWLHEQLAANNEMMANILRQLSSACVVVSQDLSVLHANKAARNLFTRPGRRSADLEFSDLPQALGSKVYQVLKTGAGLASFKFHPPETHQALFSVTIVPFQRLDAVHSNCALLVVEDQTQAEQLKRLEIEAANLRLVRSMADRLAHEIGNALVPLSTHQQLLNEKFRDAEFRASLDVAMADGVKRISRLSSQMRFLAREEPVSREAFPLRALIREAFQEAQKHQPAKAGSLQCDEDTPPTIVAGDRNALKHAFAEILLNALQANPADPKVGVHWQSEADASGGHWVRIEVQDNGAGFAPESLKKLPEPFFTTRNVGLGLGLTVCRKIIQTHHGRLELVPPHNGHDGIVRISLPQEVT
jgi:signal transduction histidine kinase/CheY-like chemotaxis protein